MSSTKLDWEHGYSFKSAMRCVGKGWRPLIRLLYAARPEKTTVTQVKEKFGGLRFYTSSAPDWYHDMIAECENLSFSMCEVCGKHGTQNKTGWIKTLCKEHRQENQHEIENV